MDILVWKMNSDNKDEPSKNVICYIVIYLVDNTDEVRFF